MQGDHFLALCDTHNSIIHEYGCDISCQKVSAICLRGCSEYEHRQKSTKHEFIDARDLYKYKMFEKDIKDFYLKKYISQLKEAVNHFQATIQQKFQIDYPLVEIFGRSSDQSLHTLIEDPQEDIQFSQLKCKDIYQLKQLYGYLSKDKKKDEEKRITKILTKIFQDYLRQQKLIAPAPASTNNKTTPNNNKNVKKYETLESQNIEQFSESTKRLMKQLEQFKLKADNLVIKIKQPILLPAQNEPPSEKLSEFVTIAKDFIEKVAPSQLIIAIKGQMVIKSFWEHIIKTIKRTGLKHIRIIFISPKDQDTFKEAQKLSQKMNLQYGGETKIQFQANDWQRDQVWFEPIV